MALYRLHKSTWEQQLRPLTEAYKEKTAKKSKGAVSSSDMGSGAGKKRKRNDDESGEHVEDNEDDEGSADEESTPSGGKRGRQARRVVGESLGGGRKGISSGLSVVVRRNGIKVKGGQPKRGKLVSTGGNWWEEGAG
jgi:RNA exonuclease 4